MKRIILLLFLLIPMALNAQVIDWKHFDKNTLNDVLSVKINDYIDSYWEIKGYSPTDHSNGEAYEAFNKVRRKDAKTYQELADKCIKYWKNDIDYTNTMSLLLWSKSIEITSNYKKINQTVYVWLTSRN